MTDPALRRSLSILLVSLALMLPPDLDFLRKIEPVHLLNMHTISCTTIVKCCLSERPSSSSSLMLMVLVVVLLLQTFGRLNLAWASLLDTKWYLMPLDGP